MSLTLITGVNGFCGYHLVNRLRRDGFERIAGIDITNEPRSDIGIDEYFQCDIASASVISLILEKLRPTRIFHLAGIMSGSKSNLIRCNCLGTLNLLNAARDHARDCRVLLVGSAAEYGRVGETELPVSETQICRPYNVYGKSKLAATLIGLNFVKKHHMRIVVARPFNVIGPGMPREVVLGAVMHRIKDSWNQSTDHPLTIRVGNTKTIRDFLAIDDVIEAYLKIIESDFWGHVFNVCSGHPRTVQSVLDILVQFVDRECSFEIDPTLVGNSDLPKIYGNPGKAKNFCGFVQSVKLENAIRTTWDYALSERA